jgi:transposase-like protein
VKTVNGIARECGVHPGQVGLWKREFQAQPAGLFEIRRGPKTVDESVSVKRL